MIRYRIGIVKQLNKHRSEAEKNVKKCVFLPKPMDDCMAMNVNRIVENIFVLIVRVSIDMFRSKKSGFELSVFNQNKRRQILIDHYFIYLEGTFQAEDYVSSQRNFLFLETFKLILRILFCQNNQFENFHRNGTEQNV